MVNPDPKWKQFEKLGEKIFKELSPNADVKWNDHIIGCNSGTSRQIDVSIRAEIEGHKILEIIQLKNWKIKANITTIDEFVSVVKDVKATSGVLICKGGFTSQAKKYAKNVGIKLFNLHDAESRDWNQEIKIPVLWIEYFPSFSSINFMITAKAHQTISFKNMSKITLSPDTGKTTIDILPMFTEKWNNGEIDKTPNKKLEFPLPDNLSVYSTLKNGITKWEPLKNFTYFYEIKRVKSLLGYFEPKECRGVIDYSNDERFIASHLPSFDEVFDIPEKGWQEIKDPEKIAINLKSTFLTIRKFDHIKPSTSKITKIQKIR